MKSRKILILAAAVAAFGGSLLAQGTDAPRFDPETAVTLKGPVVSLKAEPGTPSTLVVEDAELGKTVVRLGPSWYLKGLDFAAAEGETVEVSAATCTSCAAAYVASKVKNVTTGAIAELRDAEGFPVWRGMGKAGAGSAGRGMGCGRGRGAGHRGGCGGGGCGGGGCAGGCSGGGCGHHCGQGRGARG